MLDYYVGFRRVFPAARIRQALVVLHDIGEAIPAGYESPTLSFRYQVVKLWERDARELLAHDGLLSLAVLCRAEDNNERLLETVAKRINRLAETPERREQMNLACTLAGLRFKATDIYRLLQGGDMLEESVIYQDIARQGWQKGRHEGRAEGLQEGALLGERQLLISQLTYKFGNLSAATRKQLGRLALPQVEELGRAMLFFQTKAELLAWLRTNATSQ